MPVQDNDTVHSPPVAKEFAATINDACLTLVPKGIAHHHHYSHQENGCLSTTETPAASTQHISCPNLPLAESQAHCSSSDTQHTLPLDAEKLPVEQTSNNRQKKSTKKSSKKQPKGSSRKNLHPMQSYQRSDYNQYPLLSDAGHSSMEARGYIPMNNYSLPSSGHYELTKMHVQTPFGTYPEGYPSSVHTSSSPHHAPQHPSKTRNTKRRPSVPREINARKEGIESSLPEYAPGPHPPHMNYAYPMPLISSTVASAVPNGNTTFDMSPALPQSHLPLNSSPNTPMHTSMAISSSPPKSPEITARYSGHIRNGGTEMRGTNHRFIKDHRRPTALTREAEESITVQMERLYEQLIPSTESQTQRYRFVSKIQSICDREWPGKGIVAHLFGSSANDLGTANSDVDICLLTSWNGFVNIYIMSAVLKKYGMERVACIGGAKVPIVKFWDAEFQLACDMNVNTPISLVNTRLVKTYVAIDPRVRPFIMCVKHWTKKRALNDAAAGGTLSSYTWVCLLINFLQMRQPPILPCLHRLGQERRRKFKATQLSHMNGEETVDKFHAPKTCTGAEGEANGHSTSQYQTDNGSNHEKDENRNGAPVDVNNSNCTTLSMSERQPDRNREPAMQVYDSDGDEHAGEQFLDDLEDPLIKNFGHANHETLGGLLFAFFQRYAHEFDYDRLVVSVRHGTYLNKAEKGWNPGGRNLGLGRPYRRFAIEEPMDTQRNLGNSADDVSVYGLRREFRRALNILWDSCDFSAVCIEYNYPQVVSANKPGPEKYRRPRALSMPSSGYPNEYEYYSNSIPTPTIAAKLGAVAGAAAAASSSAGEQFYNAPPMMNPSASGHVQEMSCGSAGSRGSSVHGVKKGGGGFSSTPTSPKMDSHGLPYDCVYGARAGNPRWDGMVTSSSTTSTTGDDESDIRDNNCTGTKAETPVTFGTLQPEASADTAEMPLLSSPKYDPLIATEVHNRTDGSAELMDVNEGRVDVNVSEERITVDRRPSVDTPVAPPADYAAAARKEKKRGDSSLRTPEHGSSKRVILPTTGPVEKREQESWPSLAAASKSVRKNSKYQHIEQFAPEPDCTPLRTGPIALNRKNADQNENGVSISPVPVTIAKPSAEEGMRIHPQESAVSKGNPLAASSSTDSLLEAFSDEHVAWGRQARSGKNRKVVWFTKLSCSPPRLEHESKGQDAYKSQTEHDFANGSPAAEGMDRKSGASSATPTAISPLGLGRGKPLSTRTTLSPTPPSCPGPLMRTEDPLGLGINGASCSPIKSGQSSPAVLKCASPDSASGSSPLHKDNILNTPSLPSSSSPSTHTTSGTRFTNITQNAWQVPIKISQTPITSNRPRMAVPSNRHNDNEWPVPSVTLNAASTGPKSSRTPERKAKK